MEVLFARESLEQVRAEITPLLTKHWNEVAKFKDIALSPAWDQYEALEASDGLRIYTVRTSTGQLIGYTVFSLTRGLHYSGCLEAHEDLLYLDAGFRKGRVGSRLILFADQALADEGAQVVKRHVKFAKELNYGPLLERMGYAPIDVIYAKRLRSP